MEFSLKLNIAPLPAPITYHDTILLSGSCFTEHITERLTLHKFKTVSNPNGILFNPLSVASSLQRYLTGQQYTEDDLFYYNELWNSWQHHTRFSHPEKEIALGYMNTALNEAHKACQNAKWVIITLGSAFQYYLKDSGKPVSNNHRAPSQWFYKELLPITTITDELGKAIDQLNTVNPVANVLFTISPVRHIREGVIENNRSKARLIDAVHELCNVRSNVFYFPAYELLIDILRDYRFYDVDMVHPNFLATNYVWDRFVQACIHADAVPVMESIKEIQTAFRHRPRFPETDAHGRFRTVFAEKCHRIMVDFPYIDLQSEREYFEN